VDRACRYEPDLNRTYHELGVHYGVGILPARPYRPRDKAKVENAVLGCGSVSASTHSIAHALGKPEMQITTALDELLHQGVCHHLPGETIQIADRFWPYQRLPEPAAGLDSAAYIERIKQALLARACVRSVFSPADEKLATTLHCRRVPFEHIEHAILLGCMRKYLTLLNHNGGTPITTLHYFTGLLDEVERLEISPAYWRYVALQVKRLEKRWRSAPCAATPAQETK
jgi:hypothetical protein